MIGTPERLIRAPAQDDGYASGPDACTAQPVPALMRGGGLGGLGGFGGLGGLGAVATVETLVLACSPHVQLKAITIRPFADVHVVAVVLAKVRAQFANPELIGDPGVALVARFDRDGLRRGFHEQVGHRDC